MLTEGQKKKLRSANDGIILRLTKDQLSGNDKLLLTATQITKIEKQRRPDVGVHLKLSATQLKTLKQGGFLGALAAGLAAPFIGKVLGLCNKKGSRTETTRNKERKQIESAWNVTPLTNVDIDKMLQDTPNYLGAYCKNLIPKLGEGECVVINLEDFADGNVTHRTCIYTSEYFDSFGLPPLDIIEDQLRKLYKKVWYNPSKLQMDTSVLCGYYCAYYIRERAKGRKAIDVLFNFMQKPSRQNENIVV